MKLAIIPATIKELRLGNQLSRVDLAKRSKVSERQIARIEASNDSKLMVRDVTVERLAAALNVKVEVLTGQESKPEPEKKQNLDKQIGDAGLQVQYDLVQHRYGIKKSELDDMAPLLFTMLAEATIAWHSKRQKQLESSMNGVSEAIMIESFPNRDDPTACDYVHHHASEINFASVDEKHLFADPRQEWNPFMAYLMHLLEQIRQDHADGGGDRGDNEWDELIHLDPAFPGDKLNLPFAILEGLFNHVTDGNEKAAEELWDGRVRIQHIDEELLKDGREVERVDFLLSTSRGAQELQRELGEEVGVSDEGGGND